jgi:hypothetical protein
MAFGKDYDPYARRDYSKDSDNPYPRRQDYDDSDNPYARHYDSESDNIYERHFKSGEEIKHESAARQAPQRQSIVKSKENDPYGSDDTDPYARNYDPSSDNIYKKHIDEEGNDIDNKEDLQNDNIPNTTVQRASDNNRPQQKMTDEQRQRLERLREQNKQRHESVNKTTENKPTPGIKGGVRTASTKTEIAATTAKTEKGIEENGSKTSAGGSFKRFIVIVAILFFGAAIKILEQSGGDVQFNTIIAIIIVAVAILRVIAILNK